MQTTNENEHSNDLPKKKAGRKNSLNEKLDPHLDELIIMRINGSSYDQLIEMLATKYDLEISRTSFRRYCSEHINDKPHPHSIHAKDWWLKPNLTVDEIIVQRENVITAKPKFEEAFLARAATEGESTNEEVDDFSDINF